PFVLAASGQGAPPAVAPGRAGTGPALLGIGSHTVTDSRIQPANRHGPFRLLPIGALGVGPRHRIGSQHALTVRHLQGGRPIVANRQTGGHGCSWASAWGAGGASCRNRFILSRRAARQPSISSRSVTSTALPGFAPLRLPALMAAATSRSIS